MWIFPVLLDSRPLAGARGSLLLAPAGHGTVLEHLRARVTAVSTAPPLILARFSVDQAYQDAILEACPDVEDVEPAASLSDRLPSYRASDWLLIADPLRFPVDPLDPALHRLIVDDDPRWVRHLVTLDTGSAGTREFLDADGDGRVRGIQRYYDGVTWSRDVAVAASLVPVSCFLLARNLSITGRLEMLRHALAGHGTPSRDIPLEGGAFDLSQEHGLLALNESLVREQPRRAPRALARPAREASNHAAHPSARLVGPNVLHAGASVGEGATIIGPTVIGPDAIVGQGALVAQCVVGRGVRIAPGAVCRQRVILEADDSSVTLAEPETTPATAAAAGGWTRPLRLEQERPRQLPLGLLKRATDLLLAGVTLVAVVPLGLLIGALVKLGSRGPMLFGHLREGKDGRPFRCWKFRTMVTGADVLQRSLASGNQVDGPQFRIAGDPRLTRIGRLLKATNLDELPQLINVIRGEMSLVGPRPSPFRENQICIPWREARLSVRPGITGLWQVCRHDREKGDFHQWVYYDLLYVRHMSHWLDLKILLATPASVLLRRQIPLSALLSREQYHERRHGPRSSSAERRVTAEAEP